MPAVFTVAELDPSLECLEPFAMDGETAAKVKTVARPKVAAVVLNRTDFFMGFLFLERLTGFAFNR
jgi:hypothetical protein